MNISLPASLKSFVKEQVVDRGYGSSSAYIRELIRHEQNRQRLRGAPSSQQPRSSGRPSQAQPRGHDM